MSQLSKKTQVTQRTMFCHYREDDATFTAAYEYVDPTTVVVGYAYCSKKDQYNKTIGRAISTGRLSKVPNTLVFDVPPTNKEVVNAVVRAGISDYGDYNLALGKQTINV